MSELLRSRPPRTATAPWRYVPALDGLRGAAIVGVLLFHTGHLPGGFLGVDLFFVLSGYLITGLMLDEAQRSGRVRLVRFWGRRIRRLLPAVALMLALVTVAVWAFGPSELVRSTLGDGPWAQANLYNWHLVAESAGYWDRFGVDRAFEHLWSIAVEEQFYVAWPLIVAALARLPKAARTVPAAAVTLAAASLVLMTMLLDASEPTRVYVGTDTRAFSLLLGAAAAAPAVRGRIVRAAGAGRGPAMAVVAAGIVALWLAADGTGSSWLFPGGLLAHALLSALFITLAAGSPDSIAARWLSWRPLRWLGGVSYSLYLWHWPVIVLLPPEVTGLDGWAWTGLVWAVSLVVATASKYLVEDPVRFRARWARGRSGAVVFAAAMILLALLWVAVPEPAPPVVDVTVL